MNAVPNVSGRRECKTISKPCQECCDGTSPRSPKIGVALSFFVERTKKVRFFNKDA